MGSPGKQGSCAREVDDDIDIESKLRRSLAPGSRIGPPHECNLRYLWGVVVCFLPHHFQFVHAGKLQLAMQEQDTILEDGQAGHVDGLGSGSQTAASLPVTERKEKTRASWIAQAAQAAIDLEASGSLNFAELHGPAWPVHVSTWRSESCVCQIRHCQPTAERQRIAGQVRAGQCD